jgi:hypothetical protein
VSTLQRFVRLIMFQARAEALTESGFEPVGKKKSIRAGSR